jgi:hypothetical protein
MTSQQARSAVQEALRSRIADRAAEWFPTGPRSPEVELRLLSDRPRATVYVASLGRATGAPRVLVKVRRDVPAGPATADRGRPSLARDPRGAAELTVWEHDGLRLVEAAVSGDPRFAPVRALGHLPEHHALLLEFVDAPTVRDLLVRGSRLTRPRGSQVSDPELWRRVGAWSGVVQNATGTADRPVRQHSRSELVELFDDFGRYLTASTGAATWTDLARAGGVLAEEVFPERLPLAAGHGDFAPRNAFRCPDGRLAVFDPLFRWAVPAYEDLARFLVGLRLLGLQLHTQGAAYPLARVVQVEQEAIDGYLAAVGSEGPQEAALQEAALRCYELLLLLDKWSALVAAGRGGTTARVRAVSLRLAALFVRRQAEDVLERARRTSAGR